MPNPRAMVLAQLDGSFVFGPGGEELFAHASRDFADNASPAALLAALGA